MNMNWLEIVGTLASIIIAISLTMKNIKRLRVLNTIGALVFTVYGLLIGALPVWTLNGFIVLINCYFLLRMRATRHQFAVLERDLFESAYIQLFLDFYRTDIERYQPGFKPQPGEGWQADLVLRDMLPVSLIIYRPIDETTVELGLDYAVPAYRDYQNGRYYFEQIAGRIAAGRSLNIIQRSTVPEHQAYLRRLGFVADGELYRKVLKA